MLTLVIHLLNGSFNFSFSFAASIHFDDIYKQLFSEVIRRNKTKVGWQKLGATCELAGFTYIARHKIYNAFQPFFKIIIWNSIYVLLFIEVYVYVMDALKHFFDHLKSARYCRADSFH